MIAEQRPSASVVLYRLPRSEMPTREISGRVQDLPDQLAGLGANAFDGVVTVLARPYVMVLLLVEGHVVVAQLNAGISSVADGQAAMRELVARTDPRADAHMQVTPLRRPTAESLCAAADNEPVSTPLQDTAGLREVLRHLASLRHHGVADLEAGGDWARVLFHHGQVLGAYHSTDATLLPTLSALGRLLVAGSATLTVRRAPAGSLSRLSWPMAAAPSPAVSASATPERALPADDERDDRIESNLLWMLSNVDRDRERAAAKGAGSEGAVLQVLASFTNSTHGVAAQLAAGSALPQRLPSLRELIERLEARHPLLEELEMRGDQIDAGALVKRLRALPREGGYASEFYAGVARALLALTQHAAGSVVQQVSNPDAALRCATAVEAWLFSVEMALPATRRLA